MTFSMLFRVPVLHYRVLTFGSRILSDAPEKRPLITRRVPEWNKPVERYSGFVTFPPPLNSNEGPVKVDAPAQPEAPRERSIQTRNEASVVVDGTTLRYISGAQCGAQLENCDDRKGKALYDQLCENLAVVIEARLRRKSEKIIVATRELLSAADRKWIRFCTRQPPYGTERILCAL